MSNAVKYIALIRKEEGTDYWVDVPDIPGCVSRGQTTDEAMANFQQALESHLALMRETKQELPSPREKDDVLNAEEDEWHQAYLVEVTNRDHLQTVFTRISDL